MTTANPEILVFKKGVLVARWTLSEGEYRLGRSSGNELKLDDDGVSRKHARITVVSREVYIEDLGSRSGTIYDGRLIKDRLLLKPGEQVCIGGLSLEVLKAASPQIPDLPKATAPANNQIVSRAVAPRVVKVRPKLRPATASQEPSTIRRAVPVLIHIALIITIVGVVVHLQQEREAAANDRAAAEAERHKAEAALAPAPRASAPMPSAPRPPQPVAEPSPIPNYYAQLRPFTNQGNWSSNRIRRLADGTLRLDLSTLQIADLSALRGLPVTELDLSKCLLRALPDISFLTLRSLSIRDTAITDLTPLAAHPLKELWLDGAPATDLTPLSGLALESLTLDKRITDLTALRGLPLRELDLRNHTHIRDFRPLLECRRLDMLYVPENADIDCLREHPSLKFIAIRNPQSPKPNAVDGPTHVYYFWQKYGALMRQRAVKVSTGQIGTPRELHKEAGTPK